MTTLDPERVGAIARECLYRDHEIGPDRQVPEGAVVVEGITTSFGFHPARLATHAAEIRALLGELPDQFKEGWSFLNGCEDRHGHLWTGMHATVETLFALGMAIDAVLCCFPRDLWPSLPGGVPYYLVKAAS